MGVKENIDIDFLVNDAVDRFLSFKKYKIRLNRLGFSDDEVVQKWTDGVSLEQAVKGEVLPEEKDNINPEHYKIGGIDAIDYVRAKLTPEEYRGYLKGNIIKYISREKHKNGAEDCKKAKWFSDELVRFDEED